MFWLRRNKGESCDSSAGFLEILTQCESGSAAVEYALCTVVLVVGGVAIWWTIGSGVQSTMQQVSARMDRNAVSVAPTVSTTRTAAATAAPAVVQLTAPNRARMALAIAIVIGTSLLASALLIAPQLRAARVKANAELAVEETPTLPEQLTRDKLFAKRHQILNIFSRDMDALLEGRFCVRHIMSKRMTTVESKTSVKEIRHCMETANLHHILVCDGDRLVGIISDRDLRKTDHGTAADIMSRDLLTVGMSSPISPAITLMIQRRVHCLPVTEHGRLRGVLTTSDFMMTLQCVLQMLSQVAAEVAPDEIPEDMADQC